MCACLPYLKFIYDFVTNSVLSRIPSFHSRSRTRTRTKTKTKLSDPNHEAGPFHELRDQSGIERKTDITVSTADEEDRPANVPKGYVRNEVVRNDIRRMEDDFERRAREDMDQQKSGSGESVLLEDRV